MNILVLNGSPRPGGNTRRRIEAFRTGAASAGHHVDVMDVCRRKISGCLACEYCHTKGNGACVQKDDMQKIYDLLKEAEMLVIASPIYYHGITGQLKCVLPGSLFLYRTPAALGRALSRLYRAHDPGVPECTYAIRRIRAGVSGRYPFIPPVGRSVL